MSNRPGAIITQASIDGGLVTLDVSAGGYMIALLVLESEPESENSSQAAFNGRGILLESQLVGDEISLNGQKYEIIAGLYNNEFFDQVDAHVNKKQLELSEVSGEIPTFLDSMGNIHLVKRYEIRDESGEIESAALADRCSVMVLLGHQRLLPEGESREVGCYNQGIAKVGSTWTILKPGQSKSGYVSAHAEKKVDPPINIFRQPPSTFTVLPGLFFGLMLLFGIWQLFKSKRKSLGKKTEMEPSKNGEK